MVLLVPPQHLLQLPHQKHITVVSADASLDANLASLSSVPAVVSSDESVFTSKSIPLDTSESQAGMTIPQSLDTSTNIRPILSSILTVGQALTQLRKTIFIKHTTSCQELRLKRILPYRVISCRYI